MPLQTPNRIIRLNSGESVNLAPDVQDVLVLKSATLADVRPCMVYLPKTSERGVDVKIRAAGVGAAGQIGTANYVQILPVGSDRIEVVGTGYRLTSQYEEVVFSPKHITAQSDGLDPSGWFVRSGPFNCGVQVEIPVKLIPEGGWQRLPFGDSIVSREILGDGILWQAYETAACYMAPSDGVYDLMVNLSTVTVANVPQKKPTNGAVIGLGWTQNPAALSAPFAASYIVGDGTLGLDLSCRAMIRGVGRHLGAGFGSRFFPVIYCGEDDPVDYESEVTMGIGIRKIN